MKDLAIEEDANLEGVKCGVFKRDETRCPEKADYFLTPKSHRIIQWVVEDYDRMNPGNNLPRVELRGMCAGHYRIYNDLRTDVNRQKNQEK